MYDAPKHNGVPLVPLKYQRIHFTSCQCSLPGSLINLLTSPTAWEISSLVYTIAYIKLLTTDGYGTLDIWIISSSFLGLCSFNNLKWPAKGAPTDLTSYILNLSKTFFMYSSWDNVIFLSFLFHMVTSSFYLPSEIGVYTLII